jgi:23S rRNA (cytosine1962-C5)-methyltransferase
LRAETLRLDAFTNAYRLCHAEADGLSGLVVDRFDDCLSVELFSLGVRNLLPDLLPEFVRLCGTRHSIVQADERACQLEGFRFRPQQSDGCPQKITVTENNVRFRVDLQAGHKTGFFCDQRENRRRFGEMCGGHDVLDLCCYSGGFALYAAKLGGASQVTAVDLDEAAIAIGKKNAHLNDQRVQFVHADAFAYARQMRQNQRSYGRIVLDPPKLIVTRDDVDEGRRKYLDLNTLAMSLLADDGLMLTCSCSGLLSPADFLSIVRAAAEKLNRSVQVLDVAGAGADHPVALNCPQTEYLKAVWLRLSER